MKRLNDTELQKIIDDSNKERGNDEDHNFMPICELLDEEEFTNKDFLLTLKYSNIPHKQKIKKAIKKGVVNAVIVDGKIKLNKIYKLKYGIPPIK